MGLETQAQPLQVIPLDQQRSNYNPVGAVANMIAAFRSGQLTAADVIDRATKQPALQAEVAAATDPAQIAARETAVIEAGKQAALETKRKQFELNQAEALAKIPASSKAKVLALSNVSMVPPNVSLSNWDDSAETAVDAAYDTLKEWETEQAKAKNLRGQTKDKEFRKGINIVLGPVTADGREANRDAVASIAAWDTSYGTDVRSWISAGKPKVHTNLRTPPPGRATIGATASGAPTMVFSPDTAKTPAADSALTVEAKPLETVGAPVEGDGGIVVGSAEPRKVANTQSQQNAEMFATRGSETNRILGELDPEFDPTSAAAWAENMFFRGPLEILKGEDLKRYNSARDNWAQGLLRLESGAAISQKEQAWYEKVFFPQIGDTKQVVADKTSMRHAMEKAAANVAANGELGLQDVAKIQGIAEASEKTFAKDNAAARASRNSAQKTKLPSGKIISTLTDKNGKLWYYPSDTSKTNVPKLNVAPKK